VKKTNRVLIVEEDNLTAGWGAEIAARLSAEVFYYLDAPIKRIAAPDTPAPTAPVLEQEYLPSTAKIVARVRRLLDGS
jgi:pyruvate/2-oxoglutarate/acetoin dehydrogenase E1 component